MPLAFLVTLAFAAPPAAPVAPPGPPPEPANGTVVASWNGGLLTYADVSAPIQAELDRDEAAFLSERYETQRAELLRQVDEAILTAEAHARGLADADALLAIEVDAKVPAPTEDEIAAQWVGVQRRLPGKSKEEVRPQIIAMLTQEARGRRGEDYLKTLQQKYGVAVTLPFPDLPRAHVSVDDDPSLGPTDAPVTIVEFGDYQCPFCGKAQATMLEVLQTYRGRVRFVFRDYPLAFHGNAQSAAIAANCADAQGKFWPMHDAILAHQLALTDADLVGFAKAAGLDRARWNACRTDPAVVAEIAQDMTEATALGVNGTPAFFINGLSLSGAQPFEKFAELIDRELAGTK